MNASQNSLKSPVIVGEVLFDHFPGGKRVLGGAPFNVAWDLQGLGVGSLFVSAVGDDDEAASIESQMVDWGMTTAGIASVDAPTGRVAVTFNDGQPSYEIIQPAAFDFIPMPKQDISPETHSMLYLGSLAFRGETSKQTIRKLIQETQLPRFVDINIRRPWFDESWIETLLGSASWVKLSDEELPQLTSLNSCDDEAAILQGARELQSKLNIKNVLVTAGAGGAYFLDVNQQWTHAAAPKPSAMVDTVGAGDAFAAATIAGLIAGGQTKTVLDNAVAFASRVCSLSGATTTDRSFYRLGS